MRLPDGNRKAWNARLRRLVGEAVVSNSAISVAGVVRAFFAEAGASWQCVPGLEPWNEGKAIWSGDNV